MTKKAKQRAVIIAATVWGCCPTSGSYLETEDGLGLAMEDTCEMLNEALMLLNNSKSLPDNLTYKEAEALGKKLARGI